MIRHRWTLVLTLGLLAATAAVAQEAAPPTEAKPADEIIVANVVRDMEDDLNLVECFCKGGSCIIKPVCELKAVLCQALGAYLKTLENYTLSDLLQPEDQLAKVLGMTA